MVSNSRGVVCTHAISQLTGCFDAVVVVGVHADGVFAGGIGELAAGDRLQLHVVL